MTAPPSWPAPRAPRRPRARRWVLVPLLGGAVAIVVAFSLFISWLADLATSGAGGAGAESTVSLAPEPTTPALSYVGFDAGDIMSDAVFFDSSTMGETQIADFIATWNAGCRTGGDGTVCLADHTEDTVSQAPDRWCTGGFTGATGDTAASIVFKAARGCGINPQVLLTVLQKEQGLITASGDSLNASRYRSATGYACPDGATCDPAYRGFARQVYFAARQFQKYRSDPAAFGFVPGRTSEVAYGPNASCGSAPVAILNQATAGLYAYTPYQPDAAALVGGTDSCASFGNLNFYAYFTAWFGSTH